MTTALIPVSERDKRISELVAGLAEYGMVPNFKHRPQEYREDFHQKLFGKYYSCLQVGVARAELRAIGERYNFDFRGE